jgi:hypothetical protein
MKHRFSVLAVPAPAIDVLAFATTGCPTPSEGSAVSERALPLHGNPDRARLRSPITLTGSGFTAGRGGGDGGGGRYRPTECSPGSAGVAATTGDWGKSCQTMS